MIKIVPTLLMATAGLCLLVSSCASPKSGGVNTSSVMNTNGSGKEIPDAGAIAASTVSTSSVVGIRLLAANAGTDIDFKRTAESQIVDIMCPKGMGWAEFALPEGAQPDKIEFRLHLQGLEGCSLVYNKSKVLASVSSRGEFAIREWREDRKPLAEADRIRISLISASGSPPRIPLDGWFEIRLPQSCPDDCSLSLKWVDFYR
jgi:hypothetical protein